jgi:Mg2+/Co2+ transporter CorB
MLIIIFIIIMIFISSVFAAAETAITSVSEAKIHKLTIEGNNQAKIVTKLKKDGGILIGTILVANNALNLIVSSISTSFVLTVFGEEEAVICSLFMAFIIILFAEILPKTYAIRNSEKVSLRTALFVWYSVKVFRPITLFFNLCVNSIFKLFRIQTISTKKMLDAIDDLKGAIDYHHKDGMVHKAEKDMLANILDMYERDVKDVMIHRTQIFSVNYDMKIEELIYEILYSGFTRVPVWKGDIDNIIGIIHVKNILQYLRKNNGNEADIKIDDLMHLPSFTPETTKLKDQLIAFKEGRKHCAIVVDEYGALQGLISLTDIMDDIVGRTYDEYDVDNDVKKISDNSWLVNGTTSVRDLNGIINLELPEEEDITTISGLMMLYLEKVPVKGDSYIVDNVKLTVKKTKNNQIVTVLLEKN